MSIGSLIRISRKSLPLPIDIDFIFFLQWANSNLNYIKEFKSIIFKMNKFSLILSNSHLSPSYVFQFSKFHKFLPFWNKKIQILSDKLFLPIQNNIYLIDPKIGSTFNSRSWFNTKEFVTNEKQTFNLLTKKFTHIDKNIHKCRKIKLYLSKKQKYYFKIIIGTYRYFYNRCVSYLNNYNKNDKTSWFLIYPGDVHSKIIIKIPEEKFPYNFYFVRSILKNNFPDWLLDGFPSHLIDQAFQEAITRFTTCLSNYKKKHIRFEFKYKKKSEIEHTINLEKYMINGNNNGFFCKWKINNEYIFRTIKTSEKINKYDYIGSSITYQKKLGEYYCNLNYKEKVKINKISRYKICAIDPGVRTLATVYSANKLTEIGTEITNNKNILYKRCKEIDIIKSRIAKKGYYIKKDATKINFKLKSKDVRNLKRAMFRKIKKIKNMIKELHNKTISYLCKNYSTIIIPPFKIQEMACKLNSKIARNMYTLSWYKLKQKLKSKGEELNIRVIEKDEIYTSKTCGKCGTLHPKLGTLKIYICANCKLEIDRDYNAARNILLKNISSI